jgi:hypothetical protein
LRDGVLDWSEEVVLLYLLEAESKRGPSAAASAWAGIREHATLLALDLSWSQDPLFVRFLKAIRKKIKKSANPRKTDPLHPSALESFIRCPPERMLPRTVTQYAAMVAVGLRAVKRAADLSGVRLGGCISLPDGSWSVSFPSTKNHPEGEVVLIDPVPGALACPCALLAKWIRQRKLEGAGIDDFLFPSRSGEKGASSGVFSSAVKAVAKAAGLDYEGSKFSSRSLRAGGATAVVEAGESEAVVKAVGGWVSETFLAYVRQTAAAKRGLSTKMGFGRVSGREHSGENDQSELKLFL